MDLINTLNDWDTSLFLLLNGKHSGFFDVVMYWASDKLFWVPFYMWLFFMVYRNFNDRVLYILLFTAILITLSDQAASGLLKPLVQRLRPCHNPLIAHLVHLSSKGCGGQYGFVSSHAANAFALATYLGLLFYNIRRWLTWLMFGWAFLVGYSRIYVGVHYPGDVIVAAAIGILLGIIVHRLLNHFYPRMHAFFYNRFGSIH
jgi:undecaprenyl-diphosphatase